mmetsp:Transcript_134425/g.287591  ORF Transcript_134425/g.287591 Transcript_134425/m.287591 type:complete len:428 (+) Transcript_134425:102-1385(+)
MLRTGSLSLKCLCFSILLGWVGGQPPLDAASHKLRTPASERKFAAFVGQHGRAYRRGSREFEERLALFHQRSWEVEQHNSRPNRLWTAGLNKLSDRTELELRQLRGWRGGASASRGRGHTVGHVASHGRLFLNQNGRGRSIPQEHLNWTTLESFKTVHNQGGCGSCWALASVAVLDAHAEIYNRGMARTFSAQELLSCVPNPHSCGGTGGCDGATVELAFNWVMKQGLASDSAVPYEGVTGTCANQVDSTILLDKDAGNGHGHAEDDLGAPGVHLAQVGLPGPKFGMNAWERLPENKYEPLLRALIERGPVGVSVAASQWYSYSAGVFDNCDKNAVIDHAVTLIGFGKDKELKEKYFLIMNSWGEDWGEQGRIRLLRRDSDETEQCGIDSQPELGTACKGGPKEVKVCGMCGILYDSVVPHFAQSAP